MTETPHARSRRAALMGLVLQIIATIACAMISLRIGSIALDGLSWFLGAGVPIWFVALLVMRQHELADLEQLDLEELRRERKATGGGEALFEEEGGVGFLVARKRLEWMQRFLVPAFGLVSGGLMLGVGAWLMLRLLNFVDRLTLSKQDWPAVRQVELGLVVLSVLTLLLFLVSRYASGLARLGESKLLRACGSMTLGNTLIAVALVVAYGAQVYQQIESWEHYIAWAVPVILGLLGIETLLNFVLDIYRPRSPGTEPRACFDSRLLGLLSEPGGIAHSLAEAMNYQFGFQVSQTWFYLLLQRTLIPLFGVAVIVIWLLTTIVVVEPNERAIIERWGRQIDADHPLEPGCYFKAPWPIDIAYKYDTGRLHQFALGYRDGDSPIWHADEKDKQDERKAEKIDVEQWTDPKHSGRDHYNFVVPTPASAEDQQTTQTAAGRRSPVHIIRLEIFVEYRIRADRVSEFAVSAIDPHAVIRNVAWEELGRRSAYLSLEDLMSDSREKLVNALQASIAKRCDELHLGLRVEYVGLTNIHPDATAAAAFRKVITARQEKVTDIRNARVEEARVLSEAAGDKERATLLSHAIQRTQDNELLLSQLRAARDAVEPKSPAAARQRIGQPCMKRRSRMSSTSTRRTNSTA
ncbi:MAG: hypothetical protein HZB38_13150 [Planctomycetes bacterium]|nr:hypothetical protein [Planctomycetota bacterium]